MIHNIFNIHFWAGALVLCVGLFSHAELSAQSDIKFSAAVNTRQVLLNGNFDVVFTLSNAKGTEFSPPSFTDFIVLAGPGTSQNIQIINGKVSRQEGFSYTLMPKKAGKFTIGSASIRADGKKMTTDPISIEVLDGSKTKGTAARDEPIFLQLETAKTEGYVGEQILLDIKLYTTVNIESWDIMAEKEYQGAYAQELKRFASDTRQETIQGKTYTTRVLRRIALFPQQIGDLAIDPVKVVLAIIDDEGGYGSFFNRKIKTEIFATNSLDIKVKPLPAGAPEDFSGAVGRFDFQASINQNTATTDDAISVIVKTSGDGDVRRIQPPPPALSDSFEVYPPKILKENMEENSGEIASEKIIEYVFLPKYPGSFSIEPTFTYFDTDREEYITLREAPLTIDVAQGLTRRQPIQRESGAGVEAGDIRFIKTSAQLEKKGDSFISSPLYWALMALPIVAFLGIFFFKKIKEKQSEVDVDSIKSKQAGREARKRLSTAKKHLKAADSKAFYDEISKAMLGYVCDKLHIPLSQLTTDNLREKLKSLPISESLIEDFAKIIQTSEMALFAGMDNSPSMQSTFEKALAVLKELEALEL